MKVWGLEISHEKSLTAEYVTVSIGVISCVPAWELEFYAILGAEVLRHIKGSGRCAIPQ